MNESGTLSLINLLVCSLAFQEVPEVFDFSKVFLDVEIDSSNVTINANDLRSILWTLLRTNQCVIQAADNLFFYQGQELLVLLDPREDSLLITVKQIRHADALELKK